MSHSRIATLWRIARARLVASDPGLARFRTALAATVGLGAGLGVEYVYAHLIGFSAPRTAMLLGGIAAMQISGSLMLPSWSQRLRLVVWQPVAAGLGIGVSVGSAELGGRALHSCAFVLVTFVAVFVRRFGGHFAVIGLIGWVAFFISTFLAPPSSAVPELLGAEVLSAATVFVLSLLLWGHHPSRALRSALEAWSSQVGLLVLTAARLTSPTSTPRRRAQLSQSLRSQEIRISDTAVLIEGWLGHLRPHEGAEFRQARERLFEAHLAVDTLVEATLDLLASDGVPEVAQAETSRMLDDLARHRGADAAATAKRVLRDLEPSSPAGPEARLSAAVLQLLDASRAGFASTPQQAAEPSSQQQSAVVLPASGMLPGVAGAAAQALARQRYPRLTMPSRQAIQATVAMAVVLPLGYLISSVHYTWALVAVFIVFLGPATRGEIAVKAAHRAIGTVAGVVVAVPLAAFTSDRSARVLAVALVACFIGHYLMSVSYAYLMFFITVAVLQLYEFMGAFSVHLIGLRVFETLLGAAVAAAAAYFVLPIRTRETREHLARGFFHATAELLDDLAEGIESGTPTATTELAGTVRSLEDQARRHRLAGAPLLWHPRRGLRGDQLDLAALAAQLRQTASWTRSGQHVAETASALRSISAQAKHLAQQEKAWAGGSAGRGQQGAAPDHPVDRLRRHLSSVHRVR